MFENYIKEYGIPKENFDLIYNTKQKMEFIEEYYGDQEPVSRTNIIRFFRSCGDIERKYNKDINMFNIIEISEWFKSLKLTKVSSFYNKKNVLKKYFEWSMSQDLINYDSIKMFKEISKDDVIMSDTLDNVILKTYFKDFDDLDNGINSVIDFYNYTEIQQFETIRATFYLANAGLTFEETCNLQKNEIDYMNKIIRTNNKEFKINDTVANFLMSFVNSEGFSTSSFQGQGGFTYQNTDYVLRPVQETNVVTRAFSVANMRSKISLFISKANENEKAKDNKYYKHSFSYENIKDSGFYYNIYLFEKENNIKLDSGMLNELEKLAEKYNYSTSSLFNLYDDYHNWKMCFYKE
jgi:hypothetical protein